jgi:hypothetical protein
VQVELKSNGRSLAERYLIYLTTHFELYIGESLAQIGPKLSVTPLDTQTSKDQITRNLTLSAVLCPSA